MNNCSYLGELESGSIYIIREAYYKYRKNLALLWSMGKDSTVLVHLARKAFLGQAPIPIVHIDTGFKFKEIYAFRDRYAKRWGLNLIITKNEQAFNRGTSPEKGRFDCCHALKTEALKAAIGQYDLRALLLAIRRDEHAIRAKERYFSLRDNEFKWDYQHQPMELWAQYNAAHAASQEHLRIHPLLHWREVDVWRYIKKEKLPVVNLYFAQRAKRFRSIGCECCCQPVSSQANTVDKIIREIENTRIAERSGRAQDKEKEYMMQKLRSLGYM